MLDLLCKTEGLRRQPDRFGAVGHNRVTYRAPGVNHPPGDSLGYAELDYVLLPGRWASSVVKHAVDRRAALNADHFQ
eukprot:245504-Alexandrium_andersonii.AAC.1